MYQALTVALTQTLTEVFVIVECYALLDDDWIIAKKVAKQTNQLAKEASQKNDKSNNKIRGKRRSQPYEGAQVDEKFTKFTILIHQILD